MSTLSSKEIDSFLDLSEGELFVRFSESRKPSGFAMDDRSEDQKEEDGRAWLRRNYQSVQKEICASQLCRSVISGGNTAGRAELVAAVTDMVSIILTGVAAVLIAVIIVKRGLAEFCGSQMRV